MRSVNRVLETGYSMFGLTYLTLIVTASLHLAVSRDLTQEPGHLKAFGEGRPSQPVEEIVGSLNPTDFFENHVKPLRPIKFKGAAKDTAAFTKWSDDYFLSLEEPPEHKVSVETVKKERRDQNVEDMSFKAFVQLYNKTDHYMVNAVPSFMSQDVMIPCALQCKQLMENNFVDNVMWFSSGGTKSVVHTDGVENLNCVMRGNKTLIMVDPALYRDKVDMDHPEGSYCGVDVDKVDYNKYPGLADVEFYHVDLTPGDCLYIPYKWIHQVRSFGSNLAVNIWWKRYLKENIDYKQCNEKCNPNLTLKDATFGGFEGNIMFDPEEIRDHLQSLISPSHVLDFARFVKVLSGLRVQRIQKLGDPLYTELHETFLLCDVDKDGKLTREDLEKCKNNDIQTVGEKVNTINNLLDEIFGEKEEIDIDGTNEQKEKVTEDSDEFDKHDEL